MVDRLSDKEYSDLFNHAPCGYVKLDHKGVIIKVNTTFSSWLGFKKEELEGKYSFQNLLSMGGKIYFDTHFWPLIQLKDQVSEINLDVISKSSKRLPVLVNAVKLSSSDGNNNLVLTILDISQRKQYEKELLKAKRLAEENAAKLFEKNTELERFSHIVSHDLKSPIRTMSGLFEIMERKGFVSKDKDSMQIQKLIMDSLRRMKTLVDDLMDQTMIEKEPADFDLVDLNAVFDIVTEILDNEIKNSFTKIEVPVLPLVRGNKSQFIRLFQNLISNAIKYKGEESPFIQISWQKLEEMVQITVKDNGIGFDPIHKDRIFEYMHRLHSYSQIPGSGIGLYSCKRIVESHGGIITASSKLGYGASFIFTLPMVDPEKENKV